MIGARHQDLWAGIAHKLDNAKFHYEGMTYALRPPKPRPQNLLLMTTVPTFDDSSVRHRAFYAHFDAFLSATHSIPEIIRCCFGVDEGHRIMKAWFKDRAAAEQERRRRFNARFKPVYDAFKEMTLGCARHISEHRTGFAPVIVTINRRFGVTYIGDPLTPLPNTAPPTSQSTYGGMPPPILLGPSWADFVINGEPLFDACRSYVDHAEALIERARALVAEVHGDGELSRPPNDM
jgi:hypothetical protein